MGQVFTAIFAFIIQLFSAAEKFASAINNVAMWTDESTGTFTDEARLKRQKHVQALLEDEGIDALPTAAAKPKRRVAPPVAATTKP